MNYQIVNNSSFKITTLKKAVICVTRGFGPYIKDSIEIEFRDNWEDKELKVLQKSNMGGWYKENKILVTIGNDVKFPFMMESEYSSKRKYIDGLFIQNRQELLVALLAHEAMHLLQENVKGSILFSNILTLDDESEADIFMILMVNKWRRMKEKLKKVKYEKIIN